MCTMLREALTMSSTLRETPAMCSTLRETLVMGSTLRLESSLRTGDDEDPKARHHRGLEARRSRRGLLAKSAGESLEPPGTRGPWAIHGEAGDALGEGPWSRWGPEVRGQPAAWAGALP